jgi:hypothetical protein
VSDRPDGSPTAIDVVLSSVWAAKEAKEKVLIGLKAGAVFGEYSTVSYTVPAGKTLYIPTVTGAAVASVAANADLPQHCVSEVRAPVIGTVQIYSGSDGGGPVPLDTPIVVDAGELVVGYLTNYANHAMDLIQVLRGYEL